MTDNIPNTSPYHTFEDLPEIVRNGFKIVAEQQNFTNPSFTIALGSNVGDGMMSEMLKVTISSTKINKQGEHVPDKVLKVICKMPPASKTRREFQRTFVVFKREIEVYTKYFPFLKEYQAEKELKEEDQFKEFPKCYYGAYDEATGDAFIILEDLRDNGFIMEKKSLPLTYEHCRLVFGIFGKLHGLSLAAQQDRKEMFLEIRQNFTDLVYYMMLDKHMKEVWEQSFENARKLLNEDDVEIKIALQNLQDNLESYFKQLLLDVSCSPFAVINHGDSSLNNFMFKKDNNGKLDQISFIDWQNARYNSPVLDISYFLFTSTDKKLRDQYLDELLSHYYHTLSDTVKKLGYDSNKLFPYEKLMGQMKFYGKYGFLISLILVPFMAVPADELPDLNARFQEWKESGRLDQDSELMQVVNPTRNVVVEKRVVDNIRDAMRLGFL